MDTYSLRVAKRGLITVPKQLREAYSIEEGDTLTLVDLGGVFVLSPKKSQVDEIADRLAREWSTRGETLETMLKALREVRESYATEGQGIPGH